MTTFRVHKITHFVAKIYYSIIFPLFCFQNMLRNLFAYLERERDRDKERGTETEEKVCFSCFEPKHSFLGAQEEFNHKTTFIFNQSSL